MWEALGPGLLGLCLKRALTEVNIERINQGSKELVKGSDEIPETSLNQGSKEFVKGNDEIP